MLNSTSLLDEVSALPAAYEITIVAATVLSIAVLTVAVRFAQPWWEAKKMRDGQEKDECIRIGRNLWWTVKCMVKDGELSAERGEVWVRRLANSFPDIIPEKARAEGIKSLKQELQEKHATEEEPAKLIGELPTPSLLKRLSLAKKQATA